MFKKVEKAIREKDSGTIRKIALDQVNAGAGALDVNCGPASLDPAADMAWLIKTIQEATSATLVLDSSKPAVIESGLKICKNPAIINSTTADKEKMGILIPLAKQFKAKLIALAISDKGIPKNKDERIELAAQILQRCAEEEFPSEDIYIDPIVMPINVSQKQMKDILETIRDLKILSDPPPKTIIGLSNVSQGAKLRRIINRVFLTMAVYQGLDAAIMDPLDTNLMDALITAELVLNKDIYCDSFLEARRQKTKTDKR